VPQVTAFVALVLFDLVIYGGTLSRLGFSIRQVPRGLAVGALHSLAFVPLVFGASVLTEWFYRAIDYTHPEEHPLLRVLAETADPVLLIAIAAGATVVAPLSEELIFRGHAQTILRRMLAVFGVGATSREASSVLPPWATWGAIVLASALFAWVHEPWSRPPIFVLSVCLGWSYERTGNLWAPVAVHAVFNSVSTLFFLTLGGSN
jgi:membrane protease YdiL (CAAX protease family)